MLHSTPGFALFLKTFLSFRVAIDKSQPDYEEKKRDAERIAHEIELASVRKNRKDSIQGDEDLKSCERDGSALSEEMKYSAVQSSE